MCLDAANRAFRPHIPPRGPPENSLIDLETKIGASQQLLFQVPARRPRGKHSNPDYEQNCIWLPKSLKRKVKARLQKDEDGELSGLVESLLRDWLKNDQFQ